MLAYDFIRTQDESFDIIAVDREECDITSFSSILQCITLHEPDVVLNCAAYTAVDDAEDIGMKPCFDVNALGVKNLAKATSVFGLPFITISTDYVFDGKKKEWYAPDDACSPLGAYGMSKYLGERLAMDENPETIIVRTSWLYGWEVYNGDVSKKWVYKNFVNTMIRLSETHDELRVVSDQHWIPTSSVDLSYALAQIIHQIESEKYVGQIIHFSNACEARSITWADFAREIFRIIWKNIHIIECASSEYRIKAKRPEWSILKNISLITLPNWETWLVHFLKNKKKSHL